MKPLSYEEQIYTAIIKSSDTCFDVGANIGDTAIYLADLCRRVVAFEPVWRNYEIFCRKILATTNIIIPVNMGISNVEGSAVITVPDNDFYLGSLTSLKPDAVCTNHTISLTTIDTFIRISRIVPDFIKIDVEGAELFALQGAADTLSTAKPIMLIEVFGPWEKAFNYKPWEVFSLLLNNGYEVAFICPEGLIYHTPTKDVPFPPEYINGYNIIAYQSHHIDRMNRADAIEYRLKDRKPSTANIF